MSEVGIELTVLTKAHGILSKRIRLDGDKIHSDGSECKMGTGRAERRPIANIQDLAALIESLEPRQAITLGRMRPGLGSVMAIVSRNKLNSASLAVARAAENFVFEPGRPAWVLLDHDTKGMPEGVRNKLTAAGGFWPAIVGVCPGLAAAERLSRNSTSTGLRRIDTGEQFAGSGGLHVYPLIKDGTDFRRFLKSLNDRCWLAGLGWIALSKAGSYLDRSIIDITVAGPERLVFEGAPIVEAPLEQDQELRRPVITPGIAIDSLSVCPPLRASEMAEVRRLKTNAKQALAGERNKILNERAAHLAQQQRIPIEAARRIVDNECRGLLLSSRMLEFDDPDLINKTVADVLDDPAAFENQTLADPLNGAEGGHNKAMVMIGTDDGIPFIHSFAHHEVNYQLRFDAAAVEERIGNEDVLETFISLVLRAELSALELSDLIDVVVRRTNRRPKLIKDAVKEALRDQTMRRREAARLRMQAEQNDSRPELPRPPIDAPLTEEMAKINSILSEAPLDQRLCRDMDGHAVKPRWRPVPNTHAFSIDKEEHVPEQWMIVRLSEYGVTEEIERFINYVDENGRPVVPPRELVKAYMCRDDRVLHVLSAIAVLPIVLADGTILGCNKGFDPTRGIYFMIPEAIMALVPRLEDCTPEAVGKAMRFLTDDWLVDVNTSYVGKCVAISQTLTLIERSLLPDRPVYLYNAGRRGSGKTTLIKMTVAAATGHQAASSAWTMSEEERRKAILANFMAGVAYILWDNIPRGLQITCPHIERSCSFSYYADRRLGVSEMVATAATSIHVFTGNNIGARGELASRSLTCKLEADRPDPENREFTHPDPIDWTLKNRDEILRALFTILLGNPVLRKSPEAAMKTRFKTWWRLVGSAVENAAKQAGQEGAEEVGFEKLFLSQQDDDEDDVTWGELLVRMARQWSEIFESKQVAEVINTYQGSTQLQTMLREFLFEEQPASEKVSAKAVGNRLSRHVGNVVRFEDRAVVLRTKASKQGKGANGYFVEFLDGQPPPVEEM